MKITKKFLHQLSAVARINPAIVIGKGDDFSVMRGSTNPTTSNMAIAVKFDYVFPENVRFENVSNFIRMTTENSSVKWEKNRAVIVDEDDGSIRISTYVHENAAAKPKPWPDISEKYEEVARFKLGKKELAMMSSSSFSNIYVASNENEGVVIMASSFVGSQEFGDAYIIGVGGDVSYSTDGGFVFRNPIPYLAKPSSDEYNVVLNVKRGSGDMAILTFSSDEDGLVYHVISTEKVEGWPNTKSGLLNMHQGQ